MVAHLRAETTEQVGFLLMRHASDALLVEDFYGVAKTGLVRPSPVHAEVSEETQAWVLKEASRRGLYLGEVHSHPGPGHRAEFSESDLFGFSDFVPHVCWRLRQRAYVALVFTPQDFDSLFWLKSTDAPAGVARIAVDDVILDPTARTWHLLQTREDSERQRFARQELLLGRVGQERLRSACLGIVGIGGLGSHIVQQLAFLGVRCFVLVDGDVCERTNLNRLIGATEGDIGTPKTTIAERVIRAVESRARITAINTEFPSPLSEASLASCGIIFGCVDGDKARLALLEYSCANRIPYIDLASDAERGIGGRVVFTGLGHGCLFCRGEIDQKEVWSLGATDDQRREDRKIYGISRDALSSVGPAIVSVNGVVASLAVTEFLAFITGLRAPQPHLNYRCDLGIVTRGERLTLKTCYYCGDQWNKAAGRTSAQN
jgi:molybdopterin/thiamine biosynthesis adenylyltransferase